MPVTGLSCPLLGAGVGFPWGVRLHMLFLAMPVLGTARTASRAARRFP